ncbi:flagellar biosynthetic protein FliO [Vagococcus sp. WN89Y]|uniref:flagellar biosynthetic protein FliO n=1 Tax=Vagococcus sp. WN89Y TaxID=3457258 RepID=UPI003FCE8100
MTTQTLHTAQPVATGPETAPISYVNMGAALGLVLLLIVAAAWVLRRTGVASRIVKGNGLVSVKHTQAIGARERLMVVEVDDKWLLLGVTQQNISCLMTMDKKESAEPAAMTPPPFATSFQTALRKCLTQRKNESKK